MCRSCFKKETLKHDAALKHKYALYRVSPKGSKWYVAFNSEIELLEYIRNHINDGNETHEIICNNDGNVTHSLYFDVDAPCELFENCAITFDEFIDMIHSEVSLICIAKGVCADNYSVKRCNRADKYSAHIIYHEVNIISECSGCIPQLVIVKVKKLLEIAGINTGLAKCIDMSVYSSTKNMRLMGSPKYKNGVSVGTFIKNNKKEKFDEKTLIMIPKENAKLYKCSENNCSRKTINKDLHKKELSSEEIKTVGAFIEKNYPQLSVIKDVGNVIRLYDNHSLPCVICENSHENENPYAIIGECGETSLICRRTGKRKHIISAKKPITKKSLNKKQAKKEIIQKIIDKLGVKNESLIKKPDEITYHKFVEGITNKIAEKKHVALSSHPGSGKTTNLFTYIAGLPTDYIIVSVVHRRSLTADMRPRYKEAGFVIYDEINGIIELKKHKRILIQYESLHRLSCIGAKINLLIGDEINSICMQYLSKLAARNYRMCAYTLQYLFAATETSIVMDGMLNDYIINSINKIGCRNYYVWQNKALELQCPDAKILLNKAIFNHAIIEKLKEGKKVEVVTAAGPHFCEVMKAIILNEIPGCKILTIHSESDDYERATTEVNVVWPQYDCIIRSPSVGAGVDFTVAHFDYSFVYVISAGPLANDILQAMKRSRTINTNTYYVYFGKCATYKLPTSYDMVMSNIESNIAHRTADSLSLDFDGVLKDGKFKLKDPSDPLLQFDIWAKVYKNKQRKNVRKEVLRGLINMGATFEFIDNNPIVTASSNLDIKKITDEIKAINIKNVVAAKEITKEEYLGLKSKTRLNTEERATVNKYILRAEYKYSGDISEEWLLKYSNSRILKMNKHIGSRNENLEVFAHFSESTAEHSSDIEKLKWGKSTFMYHTAKVKIKRIFDEHNKTADFSTKMREYVNGEIKNKNPLFEGVNKVKTNNKVVLVTINNILIALGYEVTLKGIFKEINKKKIYEYSWIDIAQNYYNFDDCEIKDPLKPNFPKFNNLY